VRTRASTSARGHTGDRQTDDAWGAIRELEGRLLANPLTGGRLITYEEDTAGALPDSGLSFSSGVTRNIPHKLGRRARGFLECYGANVVTASVCALRPVPHTNGVTDATHITVNPLFTGRCFLLVF
jgi:hypothetical protein